jgi:hypothetical protein
MVTRFHIRAQAEPASLVRLLDPFAQRGLMPMAVRAQQSGEELEVMIDLPGLDEGVAANLCARMVNMVTTRSALAVSEAMTEVMTEVMTQAPPCRGSQNTA